MGNTPIEHVDFVLDTDIEGSLHPVAGESALWEACVVRVRARVDGVYELTVRATDSAGNGGADTIQVLIDRLRQVSLPRRHADGSDRDAVGAWPEKDILGTQLGPNRNGRQW